MPPTTIGLDLGTTGVKGIALDLERGLLAQETRTNALLTPHVGWAEASTEQWLTNVVDILAALIASPEVEAANVVAIATTGMVPAVVCLDQWSHPLRPAILQNDARAPTEVTELASALLAHDPLGSTGSPVTQQSVAPRALWLERNEPDLWARTELVVGSYDWLLRALGADAHVERNWALESGLVTVSGGGFAPARAVAGLDARLPEVAPPGRVVGALDPSIAARVGLSPEVALVVGGADHVLSAYAAGVASEGDWLVKLGGAGDILAVSARPVVDGRFYLDEHPVDGLWLPNGCMATSGSLVRWVQALVGGPDLSELDAEAQRRGAAEILCLPYFLGEKSPLNDPDLRGVFAGLHLGHDRADLYRSCLEGIAFGFRHNADGMREAGLPLERATVTNGGATSLLWKKIHASVLGVPLRTVVGHPGASLGAAVAAGVGVGALDWSGVARFIAEGDQIEPEPALVPLYDDAYALWRGLSEGSADTARAVARMQRTGDREQIPPTGD